MTGLLLLASLALAASPASDDAASASGPSVEVPGGQETPSPTPPTTAGALIPPVAQAPLHGPREAAGRPLPAPLHAGLQALMDACSLETCGVRGGLF